MRRTRAEIERKLADYYMFEIDRNPVACVALHVYTENNRANSQAFSRPFPRKSGHRPKTDPVRRKQGPGNGPHQTRRAIHSGVHVFPVQGRLRRGHPG